MSEMTQDTAIPESVEKFLKEHPDVESYEVVPDKIKWINVQLKSMRALIKFPTEYEGYKLTASGPDPVEEEPTVDNSVRPIPIDEVDDKLDMSNDMAQMSADEHKAPKTDDELRQLAMDIVDNKVFTDRHMNDNEANMLGSVFMPLLFMTPEQAKVVFEDVGLIYEYYAEAEQRSVNGLPIFSSVRFLSGEETERIAPMIKTLQDFKRQFLGKKEEKNEPTTTVVQSGEGNTEEQSNTDVLPLPDVHAGQTSESVPA